MLRFWFDRGVDGVRIDSAALLVKDPALPDGPDALRRPASTRSRDRDELHEIYRAWRALADRYAGERILVGELWLPDAERFARYLRPDEMHTAFNFDFLACAVARRPRCATSIDATLAAHAPVGAPATWVLSNHDVTRHVTRYGREDTSFEFAAKRDGIADRPRARHAAGPRGGAAHARAARRRSTSTRARSSACRRSRTCPDDVLQDPMYLRSGGADPGRDGCRVPLPWSGDGAAVRLQPGGPAPPRGFRSRRRGAAFTAEAQERRTRRRCSRSTARRSGIRRAEPALGDGHCAGSKQATASSRSRAETISRAS